MSFRKKSLAKPNIGALRKKSSLSNTSETQDQNGSPVKSIENSGKIDSTAAIDPKPTFGTKLAKRIKPKVNIKSATSRNQSKDEADETKKNEHIDTGQVSEEPSQSIDIEKSTNSVEKSSKTKDKEKPENENVNPKRADSKRLSKRLKVNPKLTNTRRPIATNDDNAIVFKNEQSNETNDEGKSNITVDASEGVSKSLDNETFGEKSPIPADSRIESTQNVSKLQKRKKIMPNLSIPSKATSREIALGRTESSGKSMTDEVCVAEPNNDDTPSFKKHVRFESTGETQEKNSTNSNMNHVAQLGSPKSVESPLTPGANLQPKASILKKDNYDYSSQSEGEMSHSTSLGKSKKVFKPNLGARRRKRLSSFSAYSSCDDDDDDFRHEKKKSQKSSSDKKEEAPQPTLKNTESETVSKEKKRNKKKKKDKENEEARESSESEELIMVKPLKKKTRKTYKFCTEERDISTLTMQELIFYRPKSLQRVELRANKMENDLEEVSSLTPDPTVVGDGEKNEIKGKKEKEDLGYEDEEEMIAPQVMLNENGEVVINDESLTIRKKVDHSQLKNTDILYENALSSNTHRRKISRVKRWKLNETLRFYKALSQIGTDFTLMSQAFGRFTRNELKKKFKQEERVNCDLVDMALSNRLPLNMEVFLRGKEEMQEILDEEVNALSSIVEKNETDSKRKGKSVKKETENNEVSGNDLPECRVEIERTKINVSELSKDDDCDDEEAGNENFTDFQRTDDKNQGSSSSTSTTKTIKTTNNDDGCRTKKRRLRISDKE